MAISCVGNGGTGTEKHRLAIVGRTADWLVVTATAWVAAFALYLWVFAPWLLSSRLDGKDGTVRTSFKPGDTLPVQDGQVVTTPPAATKS